jgi:hypothetical protein
MDEYEIYWAGGADDEFDDLMSRAIAAGKRAAFVWWFGEIGRALQDPSLALQVGRSLGQTVFPGGFYRDWQHGCLYIKYVIFPDQNRGWIHHIDFRPPSWA